MTPANGVVPNGLTQTTLSHPFTSPQLHSTVVALVILFYTAVRNSFPLFCSHLNVHCVASRFSFQLSLFFTLFVKNLVSITINVITITPKVNTRSPNAPVHMPLWLTPLICKSYTYCSTLLSIRSPRLHFLAITIDKCTKLHQI